MKKKKKIFDLALISLEKGSKWHFFYHLKAWIEISGYLSRNPNPRKGHNSYKKMCFFGGEGSSVCLVVKIPWKKGPNPGKKVQKEFMVV